MGNVQKAVKEADQILNVTQDAEYDLDKEAIEHGARVAKNIMTTPKIGGYSQETT